ncbi:hypothetical protein D3C73_1256560 [compost metagenome]
MPFNHLLDDVVPAVCGQPFRFIFIRAGRLIKSAGADGRHGKYTLWSIYRDIHSRPRPQAIADQMCSGDIQPLHKRRNIICKLWGVPGQIPASGSAMPSEIREITGIRILEIKDLTRKSQYSP